MTPASEERPTAASAHVDSNQRYRMVAVVTLVQVAIAMGNFAIPPLAPFLQADLHLSRMQVGTFVSALFLGAMLVSLPGGWLVDRLGSRRVLAVAQLVLGSFVVAMSQARSFPQLLLCTFIAGVGQGLASPAMTKAVITWAPEDSRATAMGIKQTGVTLGAALVAAILPTLAMISSWQQALVLVGLVVLASASVPLWAYRDLMVAAEPTPDPVGPERGWRQVLTDRNVLLISGTSILLLMVQFCFVSYMVLYLTERLAWTVTVAGLCLALGQMGGVGGRLGWGLFSDRLCKGWRRGILAVAAFLAAVTTWLLSLASAQTLPWIIFLIAMIFGFSALGWAGIQLTLVTELAGQKAAGTAAGLSVGLGYLGIISGPLLFGSLVDLTGSYSLGWQAAALVALLAMVPMLLVQEKSLSTGG